MCRGKRNYIKHFIETVLRWPLFIYCVSRSRNKMRSKQRMRFANEKHSKNINSRGSVPKSVVNNYIFVVYLCCIRVPKYAIASRCGYIYIYIYIWLYIYSNCLFLIIGKIFINVFVYA